MIAFWFFLGKRDKLSIQVLCQSFDIYASTDNFNIIIITYEIYRFIHFSIPPEKTSESYFQFSIR